eukprot:331396-Amphidinium_carterae.1
MAQNYEHWQTIKDVPKRQTPRIGVQGWAIDACTIEQRHLPARSKCYCSVTATSFDYSASAYEQ